MSRFYYITKSPDNKKEQWAVQYCRRDDVFDGGFVNFFDTKEDAEKHCRNLQDSFDEAYYKDRS